MSITNSGSGGGQIAELPRTGGFPAGWVAGIAVFMLLLGFYLVAVRRRWAS